MILIMYVLLKWICSSYNSTWFVQGFWADARRNNESDRKATIPTVHHERDTGNRMRLLYNTVLWGYRAAV